MPDAQYRYVGTRLYRRGDVIENGDVITPDDSELRAFGDLLEPVDTDAEVAADDDTPAADAAAGEGESESESEDVPVPFDGYDDLTVSDLRDVAGDLATDVLRHAYVYEQANEGRSTALQIIESEMADRDADLDSV